VPVATNGGVSPAGMLGLAGVTDMEVRVAGVSVRVVFPEILPEVAMMFAEPIAMAEARPLVLTMATDGSDELQVTWAVISQRVPSEYAPTAINCWVTPRGRLGLAGVTDREDSVAGFTVTVLLPEILPKVAVIVGVPAATAVASPLPLTVATDGSDELQVTSVVISYLVRSEYEPVAVNCWVSPRGVLGLADVTAIEDRMAKFTVRAVAPETLPKVAVMVVVPAATAVASPLLLVVATDGSEGVQVTCGVISRLIPSVYVPMAVNCRVTPTAILGLAGVIDINDRIAEVTVMFVPPEMIPAVAVMVAAPVATAVARPLLL